MADGRWPMAEFDRYVRPALAVAVPDGNFPPISG
jgi:hypothetical protein